MGRRDEILRLVDEDIMLSQLKEEKYKEIQRQGDIARGRNQLHHLGLNEAISEYFLTVARLKKVRHELAKIVVELGQEATFEYITINAEGLKALFS